VSTSGLAFGVALLAVAAATLFVMYALSGGDLCAWCAILGW
jgi:hypothetical protein